MPQSLPPTSSAVSQHSLKVYHQVQAWLGNDLDPEGYGWKIVDNKYESINTLLPVAPQFLLKIKNTVAITIVRTIVARV